MIAVVNLVLYIAMFVWAWWIFGKVYDYTMTDDDKKK